jgi:hypothetical protein
MPGGLSPPGPFPRGEEEKCCSGSYFLLTLSVDPSADVSTWPEVPRYATDLFAGTAEYYDKYRVRYPDAMLNDMTKRAGTAGEGRLLDSCHPPPGQPRACRVPCPQGSDHRCGPRGRRSRAALGGTVPPDGPAALALDDGETMTTPVRGSRPSPGAWPACRAAACARGLERREVWREVCASGTDFSPNLRVVSPYLVLPAEQGDGKGRAGLVRPADPLVARSRG